MNKTSHSSQRPAWTVMLPVILPVILLFTLIVSQITPAQAAGQLSVEILAPYNLVVDSNVKSPSTYGPSLATVAIKVCNVGDATLDNVQAYIGNHSANTPGTYPRVDSSGFPSGHPLYNSGLYYLTHVGGSDGTGDATRFVGSLAAGQCNVQYWHFTYPRCENVGGNPANPPCTNDPVWGASNDPTDDLALSFDMWATADGVATASDSWTVTMRNEISAMANKIEPNPNGEWFNTASDTINVGETVVTNGINYELGNVNQGFDNNGDTLPDYNAWLQPISSTDYDPSCFRLIRTHGVLHVSRSGGLPDLDIPFEDQLYFTGLPANNTGVVGEVYYTFLAIKGPCTGNLSPYQEVASGYENEKFNGDYGTAIPGVRSLAPELTLTKSGNPFSVPSISGGTFTYKIEVNNLSDSVDAGLTLSSGGLANMPVVTGDTVPNGLTYVAGSASNAAYNYLSYSPNTGFTVRFSTDSGATWSPTDPGNVTSTAPNNLVMIQWWMNDPIPAGSTSSYVGFQATVPGGSTPGFIENCADANLGGGSTMVSSCTTTMIQGSNTIGDLVWEDTNSNAAKDTSESGIVGVKLTLYLDRNDDGKIDSGDLKISEQDSGTNGAYSFTNLPNGNYLVQVDIYDAQVPVGTSPTTPTLYRVRGLGTTTPSPYNNADFGFGPALKLDKTQVSADPANEGDQVVFDIKLTNTRPASSGGLCTYTVWGTSLGPSNGGGGNKRWFDDTTAFSAIGPNNTYAYSKFTNVDDTVAVTAWPFSSSQFGTITKVEALYSIYLNGQLTDDRVHFQMYYNGVQVTNASVTKLAADLNPYGNDPSKEAFMVINFTGANQTETPGGDGWQWTDFSGNLLELLAVADKNTGGSDGPWIYLDAVGFRVTTDQPCGGANDDIAILPLTDDYDQTKLSFVSADPKETSVDTVNGLVSWANVGPLLGGQTKTVRVTFTALDPGAISASTNNVADVTGAKFGNGRAVNDANDTEPVTIYRTAKIGDYVWYDANGDGSQVGEGGIPGVQVRLCTTAACTTVLQTTTTDSTGHYSFTVRDGTYYVVVTQPARSTQTYDATSPYTDNTATVTVSGTDINTIDFGYNLNRARVYGRVWEDNDNDGVQDPGENGFSGATVVICTTATRPCTGTAVATITTNANGYFDWVDSASNAALSASTTYYLVSNTPGGGPWVLTYDNAPPTDGITSFATTTYPAGYVFGPYYFGYRRTPNASIIGDTIYTDWNGNGTQDAGVDEGIQGVKIYLYEDANGDGIVDPANDALIATTTTNSTGWYNFTGLPASTSPGMYLVMVDQNTLPSSYSQIKDPDQSGVCTVCDSKSVLSVDGTSSYLDRDFGYKPSGGGSIGDFVWKDIDGDGVQDAGEPGIDGIPVNLYEDTNGNGTYDPAIDALIASTTTANGGYYTFNSLYVDSTSGQRYLVDIDQSDSDVPTDGLGLKYILSAGSDPQLVILSSTTTSRTDIDFGFTAGGVIGDFVYIDANGSGQQDPGETGINGVVLTLYRDVNENGVYDGGDTQVGSPVTTANNSNGEPGYYLFTRLPAGDYVVVVTTPPSGYTQTGDPDASPICDPSCDGQGSVSRPGASYYGLNPGQIDRSVDFGYRPDGYIGDYVWLDANGDGVQDVTEAPLAGVTVELWQGGSLLRSTVTDGTGYYGFAGVADGSYEVRINTSSSSLPSGISPTYDRDGTGTPNVTAVTVSGSNAQDDIDFGYRYQGAYSISGTVFNDSNPQNGVYNSGAEPTYANIPVYLYDANNHLIATTTSNSSGLYTFGNLVGGGNQYRVVVASSSPELEGTAATTATYHDVTITTSSVTGQDFGFVSNFDLGDLPSSYHATTLGDNGARHIIPAVGSVYLGASVDTESTVTGNSTATTDDTTGSDDEDGVQAPADNDWDVGPDGGDMQVTVGGCPDVCYLSAWVDWSTGNGTTPDYSFSQTGDRILLDYPVTNGTQTITFDIPTNVTFNTGYYLHVRLYRNSTGGAASPNGVVKNGEVEDYYINLGPTAVELLSLKASAQPASLPPVLWLAAAFVLGLGTLLVIRIARRKSL